MQLGQRHHQGQAETGAFVLAVEAGLDLSEGAERGRQVRLGDADAGVGHRQRDRAALEAGRDGDLSAGLGELDGVGQQIDQHLLYRARVAVQVRQVVGQGDAERELAGVRAAAHDGQDRLHQLRDRDLAFAQLQLAGVDLGQIENVVDDREQVDAAGVDVLGIVQIARVAERPEQAVPQHLGETDDRVEGGAQLVAHIGQELGLGAVGGLKFQVLLA